MTPHLTLNLNTMRKFLMEGVWLQYLVLNKKNKTREERLDELAEIVANSLLYNKYGKDNLTSEEYSYVLNRIPHYGKLKLEERADNINEQINHHTAQLKLTTDALEMLD